MSSNRLSRQLLLVAAALAVFVASGAAAQDADIPNFVLERDTGVIDGERAFAVYAMRESGAGLGEILPPAGCTAHLAPWGRSSPVWSHPCGEWFVMPVDRYAVWVEGEDYVSRRALRIVGGSRPARSGDEGSLLFPRVVPAGRVTAAAVDVAGSTLHLMAAELRVGEPGWASLLREVPLGRAADGVPMPPGRTFAAVWDAGRSGYTALSRPFEVLAGQTTEAPLEVPAPDEAFLVARLHFVEWAHRLPEVEIELWRPHPDRAPSRHPPDAVVLRGDGIHAAWYGLPPGAVELRAESEGLDMVPLSLELEPAEVTTARARLELKASLEVELDLPRELDDEEGEHLVLSVARLPSGEVLDRARLRPGMRHFRFDRLPLDPLEVSVETVAGRFASEIRLPPGEDGFLRLAPPSAEGEATPPSVEPPAGAGTTGSGGG